MGAGSVRGISSDFYPRSPCGERRCKSGGAAPSPQFLSTLSLRRATPRPQNRKKWHNISIHALLAESDLLAIVRRRIIEIFLSTLSLRRATVEVRRSMGRPGDFYPRSPCGERRTIWWAWTCWPGHFYPRSPCGERP